MVCDTSVIGMGEEEDDEEDGESLMLQGGERHDVDVIDDGSFRGSCSCWSEVEDDDETSITSTTTNNKGVMALHLIRPHEEKYASTGPLFEFWVILR